LVLKESYITSKGCQFRVFFQKRAGKGGNQSINQTSQSVIHSIKQPSNQPINQSVNQSINQWKFIVLLEVFYSEALPTLVKWKNQWKRWEGLEGGGEPSVVIKILFTNAKLIYEVTNNCNALHLTCQGNYKL